MKIEKSSNLIEQQHTEEIQEIIASKSNWLLNWGISWVFLILILAITGSGFISYPDTITLPLKISATIPSIPVTVLEPAKLVKLLVNNNQYVTKGTGLAIINDLKEDKTLFASTTGTVCYQNILYETQSLFPGKPLFNISPPAQDFFGEIIIPQGLLAKFKEGQNVMIKLRSYPFEQFGMLHGQIKYIAEIPLKENLYVIKVDIKIKNFTDRKKTVTLKQGMEADSEVVIDDTTLLQRLSELIIKIQK